MDKNTRLKNLLKDSLLENFPDIDISEVDAMVTHWLHGSNDDIPLFTKEMSDHCISLLNSELGITGVESKAALYQNSLPLKWSDVPFPSPEDPKFRFIDLFAGIGGFRIAMQGLGGECVFSSEWDLNAKKTYEANFGEVPYGDIRKIDEREIPDHDVLCAGFPCQPFSLAGVSARNSLKSAHGFACETQGTLFFDIYRIIKEKRPAVVFLENVRNLISHDKGKTFAIIQNAFEELDYSFSPDIIDSSPLVPQRRRRCYMVCLNREIYNGRKFEFPKIEGDPRPLRLILDKNVDESFTISNKLWKGHQQRTARNLKRGTGFTAFCADLDKPSNTIVARYGKDGKECLIPQEGKNPRMLTPRECARLQGFPKKFIIPNAKTTAYKQFGNSVAVPVIKRISEDIVKLLPQKVKQYEVQ